MDARNTRWCSDGLEIGCDNGERVRVAFALDCCDREAMSFVATTSGITGEDVRDLMVAAVEHRFGPVNRLPGEIEWLTDNGSCYIARETRRFARDIGLAPCTTPLESPQSNGMAEAFVRTLKRDYVRVSPIPDAETVLRQFPPGWRTTTSFTPTARWATVRPVSSSPDQPRRSCPVFKGQQHVRTLSTQAPKLRPKAREPSTRGAAAPLIGRVLHLHPRCAPAGPVAARRPLRDACPDLPPRVGRRRRGSSDSWLQGA